MVFIKRDDVIQKIILQGTLFIENMGWPWQSHMHFPHQRHPKQYFADA
jgi:hypothetical protein